MALRTRFISLNRRLPRQREPEHRVTCVPCFKPGSDVEPGGHVLIIVRDPQGRQRSFGSLREYYTATTWPPQGESPCR
jgi:hypothetical protein